MTPRQQAVVDGILRGERYSEIAAREGVTADAIAIRARHIAEAHGFEIVPNCPGTIREAVLRMRIRELEGQ